MTSKVNYIINMKFTHILQHNFVESIRSLRIRRGEDVTQNEESLKEDSSIISITSNVKSTAMPKKRRKSLRKSNNLKHFKNKIIRSRYRK